MKFLYLGLAIGGELLGTTLLKYAEGFSKLLPTVGALLAYGFCFFFLSKTLKYLSLSVSYATWSGLGIVAATLLSVFLFKEHISWVGAAGIGFVLVGVVMLNFFGTAH